MISAEVLALIYELDDRMKKLYPGLIELRVQFFNKLKLVTANQELLNDLRQNKALYRSELRAAIGLLESVLAIEPLVAQGLELLKLEMMFAGYKEDADLPVQIRNSNNFFIRCRTACDAVVKILDAKKFIADHSSNASTIDPQSSFFSPILPAATSTFLPIQSTAPSPLG